MWVEVARDPHKKMVTGYSLNTKKSGTLQVEKRQLSQRADQVYLGNFCIARGRRANLFVKVLIGILW